jgi:hypothetical protein
MTDYLLILAACLSAATTLATVLVYDREVRRLRAEREELLDDNDLAIELLTEALNRHPANKPSLRRVK